MQRYKNLGGDSGVATFEIGSEYIKVQFTTGAMYTWTYQSAGSGNIEEMKSLARRGEGLNSFIMHRVKNDFSSKS
jgi:hypothetical protein